MNKLLMKTIGTIFSLGSIVLHSTFISKVSASILNDQFFETDSDISNRNRNPTLNEVSSKPAKYMVRDPESLATGSHLVSPRKFYNHHGIYLGDGKVVHYSGFSASLKAGPIEITDLQHFGNGSLVWVHQEQYTFSSEEIVTRALSRVGESQYKILSNNCEHFCNWCINGDSYSTQVVEYLHRPFKAVFMFFSSKLGLIA